MKPRISLSVFALWLAPFTCTFAAQPAAPTDAEIAAIVVTANQVDVDAGKLASDRAQAADVRTLAERMVVDHTGVNEQAAALARKLQLTPKTNATSESLAQGGKDNVRHLRELEGAQFDRAYVAHEIAYHESVIEALDKTLIPSARNAELRDLLVKVRPAFVGHLEHAKYVEQKLGGAGGR